MAAQIPANSSAPGAPEIDLAPPGCPVPCRQSQGGATGEVQLP